MRSAMYSWLLCLASGWVVAQAQETTREVASPMQLQTAIADGVQHVVITQHLNLDTVDPDNNSPLDDVVLVVSDATESIRVRCHALVHQMLRLQTRSRA